MVNSNSNILLVNDFVIALPSTISGNLTVIRPPSKASHGSTTINISTPMSNKYERDWLRLDQENFVPDYFTID